MNITLGISLKMYFGYQQTLSWCQQIARLLRDDALASSYSQLTLFTFPSAPVIRDAIQHFAGTPMAVGAQNIAPAPPGAWTGEISAVMLREMGCQYAEIGHAERRQYFHEDDDMVRRKIHLALDHGLTPVVCIGEAQRVPPRLAIQLASEQVNALLCATDQQISGNVIFAWEPWWAIGASAAASDDYVCEVCCGLRQYLHEHHSARQHRVIYGGSAGPGLLTRLYPYVDGLFLGRFAHNPQSVREILAEAVGLLKGEGV